MGRVLWVGAFVAISVAAVVERVWAITVPLWFDEAWAMAAAWRMERVSDVFLKLRHDNNHQLISLWDWVLGEHAPVFAYRIPSVVAGFALPGILYFAVKGRHGRRVGMIAAFLTLVSFHLIDLSSEARGYALAMAFAAGGYWFCDRFLRTRESRWAWGFVGCCVLGFLSQLSFIYVYAGFAAWSAWECRRGNWWREMVSLHGVVLIFLAWLYVWQLRYFTFWNGPHLALGELLASFVRMTFNVPGDWEWEFGALVGVLILAGLSLTVRSGEWPFYCAMIVAAGVAVGARLSRNVAPRYLAVMIPFLMCLIAVALDGVMNRGVGRNLALVALLAMGGSGIYLGYENFCRQTPGYPEAVERMAGPSVSCGADTGMDKFLAYFYCRRLGLNWVEEGSPRWWVVWPKSLHPGSIVRGGRVYELELSCPPRGAGWGWDVYERSAGEN